MEILLQFWKLGFWFPNFKRFLSQVHKGQFFLDSGWYSPLLKRLKFLAFFIWYETLHCRMRLEILKSSNFVQDFPLAKEIRFLHCRFWGRLEFLQYFDQSENLQEDFRGFDCVERYKGFIQAFFMWPIQEVFRLLI